MSPSGRSARNASYRAAAAAHRPCASRARPKSKSPSPADSCCNHGLPSRSSATAGQFRQPASARASRSTRPADPRSAPSSRNRRAACQNLPAANSSSAGSATRRHPAGSAGPTSVGLEDRTNTRPIDGSTWVRFMEIEVGGSLRVYSYPYRGPLVLVSARKKRRPPPDIRRRAAPLFRTRGLQPARPASIAWSVSTIFCADSSMSMTSASILDTK